MPAWLQHGGIDCLERFQIGFQISTFNDEIEIAREFAIKSYMARVAWRVGDVAGNPLQQLFQNRVDALELSLTQHRGPLGNGLAIA